MSRCRIFVVDENVFVAESLAILLRRQGYHVIPFQAAEKALQAMRKVPSQLVLCDIFIRGIGALDFVEQVKATYPSCKFVFLGPAEDLSGVLEESHKRGNPAHAHTKPIYPAALLSKLDIMLAHV